jgi:hypothetical protein
VSRIKKLIDSYKEFVAVPWRSDIAPDQRVIFCVYNENDELKLRARIDEFEIATKQAGHNWIIFDLTDTFAEWLSGQRYAVSYFKAPTKLTPLFPRYLDFVVNKFKESLSHQNNHQNTVVATMGVASIFGFLKAKDVVEKLAPLVPGRLLVFFPGTHENNNYRLLNGYDGWNYLAVPITADRNIV